MNSSYKFLIVTLVACSCSAFSIAQTNVVYINGSSNVDSMLITPYRDEIEKKAKVKLEILANGSEFGLRDLAVSRCDIAMISGTLQSLADNLNDQIPNLIKLNQFSEFKLGASSVVFTVNKTNPIDYLSSDELRRICIGDILNWKVLGGKDSRIIFFTMERGDGVRTVIQDELLKGDFFGVYTTVLRGEVMNEMVALLPEAIGANNIDRVNDSVKILKTDITLMQPLALVTKINSSSEVKAVVEAVLGIAAKKFSELKK